MPIDPICGMEVPTSSPWQYHKNGTTYYFCCEQCLRSFSGDAQQGVSQLVQLRLPSSAHDSSGSSCHAGANLPIQQAASYFCPMCPDVAAERPGPCPVCGMPLERTQAAGIGGGYTCPMHPQILRSSPGTCPLCGMALESVHGAMAEQTELQEMWRRFVVAVGFALPVVVLSMGPMIGLPLDAWVPPRVSVLIQFFLAVPVVTWSAWPLWMRAYLSVRSAHPNMFTLIGLGVAASFLYSFVGTWLPGWLPEMVRVHGHVPVYHEATAMIVVLVLLGQVLELRARQKTGSAIRELLALSPPTATRVRDGREEMVPLSEVQVGDLLRIRPGDKVPVDGVVEESSTTVDESMFTGEPYPVRKVPGDMLIGGTLNLSGTVLLRASRVGTDTVLAQVVQLVSQAQRSRASVHRITDRVSAHFVPAVLLVAVVTFVAWLSLDASNQRLIHALISSVSVLMIACPCALGLATPMSVTVGVGRAAQLGVLIRRAEVIERLARINTVVMDKTGTLTEGKPQVVELQAAPGYDASALLQWAASVEQFSEHPLGKAIVLAASQRGIAMEPVIDFQTVPGVGVRGNVRGRTIQVGQKHWPQRVALRWPRELEELADRWQMQARTVVFVTVDNDACGIIAVSDPIKPHARQAVSELQRLAVHVILATGDNEATARFVANQLHLSRYVANASPQEKLHLVEQLRAEGRRVAMAGDGTNDAPALAAADVGIALATGTDVAIAAADVTLLHGDIAGVVRAIQISRLVVRNIYQNLALAFGYNLLAMPVAAGVLYPLTGWVLNPMIAAAAMTVSSVSVVLNALRLRRALSRRKNGSRSRGDRESPRSHGD